MPWLVSMRMMGDVNGTPRMTMVRMSVMRSSLGLELVLVFWGSASSVSSTRNPAASAPAACLKKERRPRRAQAGNTFESVPIIVSSIAGSLVEYHQYGLIETCRGGAGTRACRVETRLDTLCGDDTASTNNLPLRGDAAGRSACATDYPRDACEKCGLDPFGQEPAIHWNRLAGDKRRSVARQEDRT